MHCWPAPWKIEGAVPFVHVLDTRWWSCVLVLFSGLVRYKYAQAIVRPLRLLATQTETEFAIDKAMLSKLRKKTGYPLIKCKNALQKFNNDVKEVG